MLHRNATQHLPQIDAATESRPAPVNTRERMRIVHVGMGSVSDGRLGGLWKGLVVQRHKSVTHAPDRTCSMILLQDARSNVKLLGFEASNGYVLLAVNGNRVTTQQEFTDAMHACRGHHVTLQFGRCLNTRQTTSVTAKVAARTVAETIATARPHPAHNRLGRDSAFVASSQTLTSPSPERIHRPMKDTQMMAGTIHVGNDHDALQPSQSCAPPANWTGNTKRVRAYNVEDNACDEEHRPAKLMKPAADEEKRPAKPAADACDDENRPAKLLTLEAEKIVDLALEETESILPLFEDAEITEKISRRLKGIRADLIAIVESNDASNAIAFFKALTKKRRLHIHWALHLMGRLRFHTKWPRPSTPQA